jgi:hypothetical protein
VEPIDEIDAKKKRRTMLENMQRSSSMFQSKAQKAETKAAEKAQRGPQQEAATAEDQLDFSSEFSNQDPGLSSEGGTDVLSNWEDLIEDDDWLSEDEDEDEDEKDDGSSPQDHSSEEEEAEPEPSIPKSWKPSTNTPSFMNRSPAVPPKKPASVSPQKDDTTVEKKLGFDWGPVDKKVPVAESGTPAPVQEAPQTTAAPFSATRRGGWQGLPTNVPEVSPRARPLGGLMLPPRGQLKQVDSKVVSAARLLVETPEDEPGYEECIRLLSRFGLGAIRLCSKAKVKVHILDEKGIAGFPELVEMGLSPEEFPVDGAYLVQSKTCLIDRRCLTEKPQFFHPALYYFAHALDYAQGGDDFSSRKAAAVLACFDSCCSGYNGADFVDELAAADPVRYFARSVAIYLGRDDCTDPIWTHQDLFDLDRSMYDYLQYLFGRFAV